jgi:hypothetical protein
MFSEILTRLFLRNAGHLTKERNYEILKTIKEKRR